MAKKLEKIQDPAHFRRIKKRLLDAGLELPGYSTSVSYWRNRSLEWTNGSTLEEVSRVLVQHVDLESCPLTLLRTTDLDHLYYTTQERFSGTDIAQFGTEAPLDPSRTGALLREHAQTTARLALRDPRAAVKRLRALYQLAKPHLVTGDEVCALAALVCRDREQEGWKALVRALVALEGLDATRTTHAELEAARQGREGACTELLTRDARCPSCDVVLELSGLAELDPHSWTEISPVHARVLAAESSKTRAGLRSQLERIQGLRTGSATKDLAPNEREALVAVSRSAVESAHLQLLKQRNIALRPAGPGTPRIEELVEVVERARTQNPGRTRFHVRCPSAVLRQPMTAAQLEAFEGVEVSRFRADTDEVRVEGHQRHLLVEHHLAPSTLTPEQGAVYSQLRADGVRSEQAHEMATLL